MSKLKELQEQIEKERARLDKVMGEGDFEIYYSQSVLLDRLIEQYIELTEDKNELVV